MTRRQLSLYHRLAVQRQDERDAELIKIVALGSSADPKKLLRR